MPCFTKYTCTKCDFSDTNISTWGAHTYMLKYGELSVNRTNGLCHSCNEIVSVEVLDNETSLDHSKSEQLLRQAFIQSRISKPRCLKCGSHEFDIIKKIQGNIGERNPFDTGLIHHNCGGRILADNDTPNLFFGDSLPKRYFDEEGNLLPEYCAE